MEWRRSCHFLREALRRDELVRADPCGRQVAIERLEQIGLDVGAQIGVVQRRNIGGVAAGHIRKLLIPEYGYGHGDVLYRVTRILLLELLLEQHQDWRIVGLGPHEAWPKNIGRE